MLNFELELQNIDTEFFRHIPSQSGVYIMKSVDGDVLYVGKSNNLKARVRSYYRKSGDKRHSVKFIRERVKKIEFCLTDTEKEALILENNLIKKFSPRYNIKLRDDKNFFYISVNRKHPFPSLQLIRNRKDKTLLYFGPYSSSGKIKETIKYIQGIYPLRSCKWSVFKNRRRPCLLFQIKKCCAPCCGKISIEDYNVMLNDVILFLEGKKQELIDSLKRQMTRASESQEYEKAVLFRNRIFAIEQSLQRQGVESSVRTDRDVLGVCYDDKRISVNILEVRDGKLQGSDNFVLKHNGLPEDEVISSFLRQFYLDRKALANILVRELPEDAKVLEEHFSEKAGRKVKILQPMRGENLRFLKMAEKNANQNLVYKDRVCSDLNVVKKQLHIQNVPNRMECFDISNFQGDFAVGSGVVFIDGRAKKSLYRRYKIKTVDGQNDVAMMKEVLQRRLERAVKEDVFPDLCIVDGGRGQLSAVYNHYLSLKNVPHIDFIGLAKEGDGECEKVFLAQRKNPILLKKSGYLKNLLDRIRDEAHRFAITYHRKLRKKSTLTSQLLNIPNVGDHREKLLMIHFGNVSKIKSATLEQLMLIKGIGTNTSDRIYKFYHPDGV